MNETPIPTIRALIRDFADGMQRPSELLERCLAAIGRANPGINALPTLRPAEALRDAAMEMDARLSAGEPVGPLAGLPYAAKDTHRTAGLRTTRGSPIFADEVPTVNDPIVQRLLDAGALLVGKSNTPEFAAGSQTFNPVLGTTRNPWDPTRTVGGSSGGGAAALASAMVLVADGSDLAASLRNPASFCGVAGMRPTSRSQPALRMHADAFSTLSMVGPMARGVDDLRLAYRAIHDPRPVRPIAAWSASMREESVATGRGAAALGLPGTPRIPSKLRIAWTVDCDGAMPVSAPVRGTILAAVDRLRDAGVELIEAAPDFSGADECFQVLRGLFFVEMLGDLYQTDKARMKDTVAWNVEFGLSLDAARIARATRMRSELFERTACFASGFDAWLLPTAQVLPFDLSIPHPTEIEGRALRTYIDWLSSCYWISTAGHPAVSINSGWASDGGAPLPVGLQLMGRWGEDEALLDIAETVEAILAPAARPPIEPGFQITAGRFGSSSGFGPSGGKA
ncbi:MAG: hypothetical protein RIS35_229 [Pseudomonadota bacterium]